MAAFLGVQYKGILGSGFALGQKGIRMPSGGALLLDQYSGAAAAYSVRKLSSSYSGSALRVRRSSDNTEQDIGFSGNDLDTSALTTFVGANDGFVVTWYDQSGNGNDATNSTAAQQPQIVSSGSLITENGVAALDSNQDFFSIPSVAMDGYLFAVTKNDGTSNYQPLFGDLIITGLTSGGSKWEMRKKADSSVLILTSESATVQSLLSYDTQANQAEIYVNGVSGGTDTSTNAYPAANTLMFASGVTSYQGTIQEVVVYNSDQNTNRAAIESNINTYYNIYWDGTQTSLLDDYPSSSAAYSVRALNSAYTGPLLRVRRSSDNAEQDIRALYDGNLDEEGLLNFVGANDGFVVTWYDQSGNEADALQSTASDQPIIVSSGTLVTKGGKAAVSLLSGANAHMENPVSIVSSTQDAYYVIDTLSDTSFVIVGSYPSGTRAGLIGQSGSSDTTLQANYGTPTYYSNGVEFVGTTRGDLYTSFNGYKLQSHIATNTLGFTNGISVGALITGNALNLNGYIQEEVYYNSDTSANRAAIESNINAYYDVYWDGTVSDPDAQAYLDEVVAQGGSLTNKVANEYNDFVLREKANSRYSKIKRLYPFLGGVIDSARVDAIGLSGATNNNFVDADADATCGLQGDGSTKYLNVGSAFNSIITSLTDAQFGYFMLGASDEGVDSYPMGTINTITDTWTVLRKTSADLLVGYLDNGSTGIAPWGQDITGQNDVSVIAARFSSTSAYVYTNGTAGTEATTPISKSLSSLNPYIFARNLNGGASAFANIKLGGSFIAEGLTFSEVSAFESSYKTFLTNIGAI